MRVKDFLLETMITHLLELCKQELELEDVPPIEIISDRDTIDGQSSFGIFDGSIKVISKNRHPMDVMRTLAHELVHWKQRMQGEPMSGEDGSPTENAANAIAGIILRRFGKMYPEYFINSLPER